MLDMPERAALAATPDLKPSPPTTDPAPRTLSGSGTDATRAYISMCTDELAAVFHPRASDGGSLGHTSPSSRISHRALPPCDVRQHAL
eukprot:1504431-Pyramimonas_sp.AAC.1